MTVIRTMSISDYDQIFDLWRNTPGMGLNTTDDSREGIEKYLKRNPTTCFVAETEGEIVGVIMAGHDGRRGFIHHAAVLPDFRKQGIGKQLVDHAIAALDKEGIHKVGLAVFTTNAIGNRFWERVGFFKREDIVYRSKFIHSLTSIDT